MRILVIRRDNIGDLVCTTPLLAMLRKALPLAEIDVLANSYNAPVLEGNPDVSRVWVYTKSKHRAPDEGRVGTILRSLGTLRAIRARRYDWAIVAGGIATREALAAAGRSGASRLLGYRPADPRAASPSDLWLDPVPVPRHEVIDCFELGRVLLHEFGHGSVPEVPGPLKIFADPARAQALGTLAELDRASRPIVALMFGAREPDRRWPVERYREIIAQLPERIPGATPLLLWSPSSASAATGHDEAEIARQLRAETGVAGGPTDSLTDLVAVLSLTDCVIAADGGPVHIAAALGKRVVALFENRPEKYLRWFPWKARSRTVISPGGPVSDIEVTDVLEATAALVHPG